MTALIIWILLWIPLSFLFPAHAHFPLTGALAPIGAIFIALGGGGSSQSSIEFDWKYVYAPTLFFWVGGAIFLWLATSKLFRSGGSIDGQNKNDKQG